MWTLGTRTENGRLDIRLERNLQGTGRTVTLYFIGDIDLSEPERRRRLANALLRRHASRSAAALLWHLGAATEAGGFNLDGAAQPGDTRPHAERLSAFLASAGDYGLWWPETWRAVSDRLALLLGIALDVRLSIVFLVPRVDSRPTDWSAEIPDHNGKSLATILQKRGSLDEKLGMRTLRPVLVVGEGPKGSSFVNFAAFECLGHEAFVSQLESHQSGADELPSDDAVEIIGLDDWIEQVRDQARMAPGWRLSKAPQGGYMVYTQAESPSPSDGVLVSLPQPPFSYNHSVEDGGRIVFERR